MLVPNNHHASLHIHSQSGGAGECVEEEGVVVQHSLHAEGLVEQLVGTVEGQPLSSPNRSYGMSMYMHHIITCHSKPNIISSMHILCVCLSTYFQHTRKTKSSSHWKCPLAVPKRKEKDKEEEESECVSSPPPAKMSRRKSSKDKQVKVAPDLGKMTMAELISYNPSANPMQ